MNIAEPERTVPVMVKDSSSPEFSPIQLPAMTVLIVDDVRENLDLLEYHLNSHSYKTISASDGKEALVQLRKHHVDLIVSDAMMPNMDGFQLCKEVKSKPQFRRIPFVIYTSNYLDTEDEAFARRLGVDRYVMKSDINELLRIVKETSEARTVEQLILTDEGEDGIDDGAFLKKHHALVVKKLDQKIDELKMYAEVLSRKNRELQVSERRYRGLFEHSSIAIFSVDGLTGRIVDVNRQGIGLLGFSKEEMLALARFPFVLVDGEQHSADVREEFRSGERRIRTKGGKTLDVEVRTGHASTDHEDRFILYIRDITEEKKLRQQLMHTEKMTLMGRLAGGIAHEIRNPLAAVLLNLQYLLQKCPQDSPDCGFLESAAEGANRINQVVQNTLNLARSAPPFLKEENINDIVQTALWFMKVPAQQKNIKIELHLTEELPPVHADAKQIQQVLLNLMQNAIDASPDGSTVIVTSGALQNLADGGELVTHKVVMVIKDSGAGIPDEQLRNIFEPLRTTKAGGTGLGLALSKYIMDQHKAELSIERALGGGTIARMIFAVNRNERGDVHAQG
jgi:two-component system, cell cycle sensor histidine kinase and response regulator CckA